MKFISLIIPVYNRADLVHENVNRIIRVLEGIEGIRYELILIDDGSSDGSGEQLERIKRRGVLTLSKVNGGLGSVLRTGFKIASGDYVIYLDLDLSYGLENITKLIKQAGLADVVVCSKYRSSNSYPALRRLLSYLNYLFLHLLFGINVRDSGSGLVMIRASLLEGIGLISNGFGVHPELFYLLAKGGARIVELPIRYRHLPGSFRMISHSIKTLKELLQLFYHYKIKGHLAAPA